MAIVGRRKEQERLLGLLGSATHGLGGSLLIAGEPGIGKTALLQELAAQAESKFDVRTVTGIPTEQGLPYAALHTLLLRGPSDRELIGMDPVLAAITGMQNTTTPPLAIAVAAAVLAHFSTLGEQKPILLVIDDLQWIDPSSAMALVFAARRLLADRVAFVFGLRTDTTLLAPANDAAAILTASAQGMAAANELVVVGNDLRGIERINLDLLSDIESVDLLRAKGVSLEAANIAAARGGGLPLALMELGDEFSSPDGLSDRINVNLPSMYKERIAALPSNAQRLCVAAALDDDIRMLTMFFQDDLIPSLDAAENAGVLAHRDGHLRFRHPLLRAAALNTISTNEERRLRARFVDLLTSAAHSNFESEILDRVALHRASAALGIDEVAATSLSDFAKRAYARGASQEAFEAYLRAGQLTGSRANRATWTLHAAEIIYNAGNAVKGLELAEELKRTHSDIDLSPTLETLIANASQWDRDPHITVQRFRDEANAVVTSDPRRAAWLLAHSSSVGFLSGDLLAGIDDADRAIELADACGEFLAGMLARGNLVWSLFLRADQSRHNDERATVTTIMELASQSETIEGVTVGQAVVMMAVIEERWETADELLAQMSAVARRLGLRLSVVMFAMVQGAVSFRRGRWQEGLLLATHDLDEGELPVVAKAWGRAAASSITAAMGDRTRTEELTGDALEVAHSLRIPLIAAWSYASLGHLELSHGRPDLALPHLDRVAGLVSEMGLREPCFFLWQGDWIDALIAMNLRAEVEAAIEELMEVADITGRAWARAVVARSEACISSSSMAAENQFETAVKEFATLGMPFESARTLLARGKRRIKEGRPQAAADISEAGRIFRRLGARSWVARAEEESGVSISLDERVNLVNLLSSSELRVALAVAAGRTNKQVSTELYLSVKTVEFHVQSIYKKINVKNRAEFVRSFSQLVE